jgi:hypothetical protein
MVAFPGSTLLASIEPASAGGPKRVSIVQENRIDQGAFIGVNRRSDLLPDESNVVSPGTLHAVKPIVSSTPNVAVVVLQESIDTGSAWSLAWAIDPKALFASGLVSAYAAICGDPIGSVPGFQ